MRRPSTNGRFHAGLAALLAAWLLASAGHAEVPVPDPAAIDEQEAKQRFEAGRVHYENGDFVRAAAEFAQSYAKSGGRHELLYNLYLAYRDANLQDQAIETLEAYLARADVVSNRAMLESRLAALKQGQASASAGDAASALPAPQESAASPAPAHPDARHTARKVPVGPLVVTVAGGAMVLASVGTGLYARSTYRDIEKSCVDGTQGCDPRLESKRDRGQKLARATDGLLFGGVALALTGGIWWWLSGDGDDEEGSHAELMCDSSGCLGSYTTRF